MKSWKSGDIKYLGKLDRNGINELYGKAVVGLCILKPIPNYFFSNPIKIYEYMAAGIPFISSDFPGWKFIAEQSGGGLCVSFKNVKNIRNKIEFLLTNRNIAEKMGEKGRNYV